MYPRFVDSAVRDAVAFSRIAVSSIILGGLLGMVTFIITNGLGWSSELSWAVSVYVGLVLTWTLFLLSSQTNPARQPLRGIIVLSAGIIAFNEWTWYVVLRDPSGTAIAIVLISAVISVLGLRYLWKLTFGKPPSPQMFSSHWK